eukprot:m.661802 g.661802  ORF g.661802 m.661802 type:complete len:363 (+) comp22737_c2_seq1:1838-2926(+)
MAPPIASNFVLSTGSLRCLVILILLLQDVTSNTAAMTLAKNSNYRSVFVRYLPPVSTLLIHPSCATPCTPVLQCPTMITITFICILLAGVTPLVPAQDTNACDAYDTESGTGFCNGTEINVYQVLCPEWNKEACQVSQTLSDGRQETYFFRGIPSGLPAAADIQSDCSATDFPASGGVAVAQTYQAGGSPAGCYPAANLADTQMFYSAVDGRITSVTVSFGIHIDGNGEQRDAFIQIRCSPLATAPFRYSTIGDQGHPAQYEIDVEAPCIHSTRTVPTRTVSTRTVTTTATMATTSQIQQTEKRSNTGTIIIAVAISAALILFVVAGYFVYRSHNGILRAWPCQKDKISDHSDDDAGLITYE